MFSFMFTELHVVPAGKRSNLTTVLYFWLPEAAHQNSQSSNDTIEEPFENKYEYC